MTFVHVDSQMLKQRIIRPYRGVFMQYLLQWFLPFYLLVSVLPATLRAQDVTFESSTMHDQNIFDIYAQSPDQIHRFQIDVSKDWDVDPATLTLSYNGSLFLFNDLTARNYHVHVVTFGSLFQFYSDDEEQEHENDEDSTEADEDSTGLSLKQPQHVPLVPVVHSDSADRFLYLTLVGASQFDKESFSQYDNSKIEGTATFRQPLGLLVSIRPSYTLSYHVYQNLPGLTNIENLVSVLAGTNFIKNVWCSAGAGYNLKKYTTSTTYTYTVGPNVLPGHGKPGAGGGGKRTKTYSLNTPSVRQFTATAHWIQQLFPDTRLLAQYTYYGSPSSEARILPRQLLSTIQEQGSIGTFASENDIFDDHYGYSGNGVGVEVQQTLPLAFQLTAKGNYLKKTYTIPAMDLSDSVVVAGRRIDKRFEGQLTVSKTIKLGEGQNLKPKIEVQYLRNNSNAPYYDFDKNTFLIGIEFNF